MQIRFPGIPDRHPISNDPELEDVNHLLKEKIRHIVRLAPPSKQVQQRHPELPTYKELRDLKIITQKRAAGLLGCSTRNVRLYVKQRKLNKTTTGKICCDEKLKVEMQKKYPHVFRLN